MAVLVNILVLVLVASCAAQEGTRESDRSLKSGQPDDDKNDPKCPPSDAIAPCTCSFFGNVHPYTTCSGDSVTQDTIDNLFTQLREANNLEPSEKLTINQFSLDRTKLTTLDVTSQLNSNIRLYDLRGNEQLTSIIGPQLRSGSDIEPAGFINSEVIQFESSWYLNDSGFGNFLHYFEPTLYRFSMGGNNITGGHYPISDNSGDVEFLPGLGSFAKLGNLFLTGMRNLKRLSGGQFKRNSQLTYIGFQWSSIGEIDTDAFLFKDNSLDKELTINLYDNLVTDSTFSAIQTNGLASGERPINLILRANKLTTLVESNFRPFLQANEKNSLNVQDNKFQCDRKMRWLKLNKRAYQSRVTNATCANDNGRSVFESRKV